MSNTVIRRLIPALPAICILPAVVLLALCTWPTVRSAGAALVAPSLPPRLVGHLAILAGAWALTVVVAWLLASWVVCWVSVLRHGSAAFVETWWLRPRFVRVLVTACLGAVVASGQSA